VERGYHFAKVSHAKKLCGEEETTFATCQVRCRSKRWFKSNTS